MNKVEAHEGAPPDAVVVVGASAGGVEALQRLVADLPKELPAAVLVVLHVPADGSFLPQILLRAGSLPASHAEDKEPLVAGRILVAPPDRHLVVEDTRVRVVRGPQENYHRPAVDPLFRSAAVAYGPRTVAVVLSGALDDGAAGADAVARHGGTVIVQDPEEAPFASMPLHAIAADHPREIVSVATMGAAVTNAVERVLAMSADEQPERDRDEREIELAEFELETVEGTKLGEPSPFSCPTCGGVLREAPGELLRFRCRVGHAFGADGLLAGQSQTVDEALWTALRSLQERAELARRLASRMRDQGHKERAGRYEQRREEAEQAERTLRELLLGRDVESA